MALAKKIFDSRTLVQQGQINKALAEKGLGQLHDEGLLDQLAMCVQNHDRFRKLLARTPPEQRQNCYDCLAPRLMFKALPLEDYMTETKDLASASESRMQPVVIGEDTVIPAAETLEQRAEFAIGLSLAQQNARGRLTVACTRCTEEVQMFAANRKDAYETLACFGWKFEGDKAWCPECAKPLRKNG